MFFWIPSSLIIARACPKGLEASSYAFLAGLSNLALMVAELLGSFLIKFAGVTKCNFQNLWILILIFHILSPAIIGTAATLLIPNVEQDEKMLEEEELEPLELIRETEENDIELTHYITNEVVSLDNDFTFDGEISD
jgi:hypothetical protein